VVSAPLRIVSRGSELALWQARAVRDALGGEAEIRVVKTTGDRILDVPLSRIGDKGLFTKELDAALLAGEADLAVHSLKDVPTRLPEGLVLAAVTEREDPRDVLLLPGGAPGSLAALPAGARVGTSSLRRRAQLGAARPELEVAELRGNLHTRLAKLDRGEYDAIVLAAAGVVRLGWGERIAERLDPPGWLPAVGQGALAIVARADRAEVAGRLLPLHDPATAAAVAAERALLRALEGGCQVPIGALGRVEDGVLTLRGLVASLDGTRVVRTEASGAPEEAEEVGLRAAAALAAGGGAEILAAVRSAAAPMPAAP
jgi:hydroxymethylbilane synthase